MDGVGRPWSRTEDVLQCKLEHLPAAKVHKQPRQRLYHAVLLKNNFWV
jgi:hypothetical protein